MRWESVVRVWFSDLEEPEVIVLHRRRFRWNARLDTKLASPNLAALAFLNTLHPEHMVVAVQYDVREAV